MAAGFSCGGTEAMDDVWDSRMDTISIISSRLLSNYTAASAWRKPVLLVLGGSGDIAYQNVSFHSRIARCNSTNELEISELTVSLW